MFVIGVDLQVFVDTTKELKNEERWWFDFLDYFLLFCGCLIVRLFWLL
jgi:hypothetical protein